MTNFLDHTRMATVHSLSYCASLWVVMAHWPKLPWGRKDLFYLTTPKSWSTTEGSQDGTWTRSGDLEARTEAKTPWSNVVYWLAFFDSFSFLSYLTQEHLPRGGTAHSGTPPLQSLIKCPYSRCPQATTATDMPTGLETIPQLKSPLPRWPYFVSNWQKLTSLGLKHKCHSLSLTLRGKLYKM